MWSRRRCPGYGFSEPTRTRGWDTWRIARAFVELMSGLGYSRYGAQGGDWGAQVTTRIGALDPEHCAGAPPQHADRASRPRDASQLTDADKADLAAMAHFQREEAGYANEQSTKPQTLGVALNDSPAGLARVDRREVPRAGATATATPRTCSPATSCITNVMVYWVTGTSASSARLYWEHQHRASVEGAPEYVEVPTGIARYPEGDRALPALVGRAAATTSRTGSTCRAAATSPRWSNPSCSSTTCARSSEPCAERSLRHEFRVRERLDGGPVLLEDVAALRSRRRPPRRTASS